MNTALEVDTVNSHVPASELISSIIAEHDPEIKVKLYRILNLPLRQKLDNCVSGTRQLATKTNHQRF